MRKKQIISKITALGTMTVLALGCPGMEASAAIDDAKVAAAYDEAANIQGNLDGIDVVVKETTMIPGQKDQSGKTVRMKVSGLQSEHDLKAAITVTTEEGDRTQYYTDGYYYTDQSGEKVKYKMDQAQMLELLNYEVYLNFDSGRLDTLTMSKKGDNAVYSFSATQETVGSYADQILEGVLEEHQMEIVTIQGSMETTKENEIANRQLQTVYMVQAEGRKQACIIDSQAEFKNPGAKVTVEIPELKNYHEQGKKEAAVEIIPQQGTVYATDTVNIRALNNITAAIIGGAARATALSKTGYTTDGWIQINYNGAVGYVSADYVSDTRPVVIADMSGTMYATTGVYVRNAAGTDGSVLGSLADGDSVKVTGYTDNGWIRVQYKGNTAFVYADYLSWEEPVRVVNGYLSGIIKDVTWNTVTVKDTDGSAYTFKTSDAYMNVVDGLIVGDRVDIAFQNVNGTYVATQINDYTYHEEKKEEYAPDLVYGVVMAYGKNSVTISCNDGTSMTFLKEDAVIRGQVYVGAYVSASYYYDSSIGGYHLTYLSAV